MISGKHDSGPERCADDRYPRDPWPNYRHCPNLAVCGDKVSTARLWAIIIGLCGLSLYMGFRIGSLERTIDDQNHYINEGCPVQQGE
jgi:hypothetical protein